MVQFFLPHSVGARTCGNGKRIRRRGTIGTTFCSRATLYSTRPDYS